MQLIQLITFAALSLSHARAAPSLAQDQLALVEQIVTLTTRPDIVIKSTPELKPFEGLASRSPLLFDHQLHQGAAESLTSLRSYGDDKTAHIYQSIAAYHGTADPVRSQIYRDSIYSRIVDLVKDNPEEAKAHLQVAHKHMLKSLDDMVSSWKEQPLLKPMGNQKVIAQMEQLVARFNDQNKERIHEYTQKALSMLPSNREFKPMKYLTRDEVNEALKATASPNSPAPVLIDGFKSFETHAPAHPVTPIVKPPTAAAAA